MRVESNAAEVTRPAVARPHGTHRTGETGPESDLPPVALRAEIGASWARMLRSGLDPDQSTESVVLERDEVERRRRTSALNEVMPLLDESLGSLADTAQQIVVVTDVEGRVLWRRGSAGALRRADGIFLAEGATWAEESTGTNAIGTALVSRAPVQVHSSEHFVRRLHGWTCAAAPVRDPRDGRLMGVVDMSGPASTFHPTSLALVGSVGRLAESELRNRHLRALDRLRSVAAPLLCRLGGRAVAVDTHGWVAAVTGMPPAERLPLSKSMGAGRIWLPSLGMCEAEPLPGGWLVRVADEAADGPRRRVVLDLSRPHGLSVSVVGAVDTWTRPLSPRHAELLYALALHREGRTASELAEDVFGDATRTVTVRAEISRIRRQLAEVLAHRPYRFGEKVEVEVIHPDQPADLLPRSKAPVVVRARTP